MSVLVLKRTGLGRNLEDRVVPEPGTGPKAILCVLRVSRRVAWSTKRAPGISGCDDSGSRRSWSFCSMICRMRGDRA